MGFKYINELSKNISNKINPLIIYRNWGHGVTAVLSGLRLKTNPNLIIVIDLDKKISDEVPGILKCKNKTTYNDGFTITKSCILNSPTYITGLILDRELKKNENISITFFTKQKELKKFNINSNNLISSPKISSYKIPYKNTNLFDVIQYENLLEGHLEINIKSDYKLGFSLTGFNKNSEPAYKLNQHYILNWDKEDARNYLGIDKSVMTNNLEFKDKETCIMLFEIFKNKPNHNPLRHNNDCL